MLDLSRSFGKHHKVQSMLLMMGLSWCGSKTLCDKGYAAALKFD